MSACSECDGRGGHGAMLSYDCAKYGGESWMEDECAHCAGTGEEPEDEDELEEAA